MSDRSTSLADAMRQINDAWLQRRVDDLAPLVHDDIVMVLPGFAGRMAGREAFLAGFRDFCEQATIRDFREDEHQIDVVGATGVVTFSYQMVYERGGASFRVTGREVWIFEWQDTSWIAVWRTMLDLEETPA